MQEKRCQGKTRSIHLPKASLPMPSESQEVRFWSLPNENGQGLMMNSQLHRGEIVESTAPIVLAHELLASLGRSATDLSSDCKIKKKEIKNKENDSE